MDGESTPYLGRDYRIEVTATVSGEIEFSQLFLVPPAQQAKRREVLRDWYIARAKEKMTTAGNPGGPVTTWVPHRRKTRE